jgi:hypothetical protein
VLGDGTLYYLGKFKPHFYLTRQCMVRNMLPHPFPCKFSAGNSGDGLGKKSAGCPIDSCYMFWPVLGWEKGPEPTRKGRPEDLERSFQGEWPGRTGRACAGFCWPQSRRDLKGSRVPQRTRRFLLPKLSTEFHQDHPDSRGGASRSFRERR